MTHNAENDPLTEAADIDAELCELQSFVLVETGHMPTVNAVAALRSRIAKTLGHSDPWCVAHCRPGVKHSACGCRCGQHRRRVLPPGNGGAQ